MRSIAISFLCLSMLGCGSDDDSGKKASTGGSGGKGASGGAPSGGSGGTQSGGSGGTPTGGAGGTTTGGSGGTPGTPEVAFVGRTDTSEPGVTRFAWSGSGIVFRFSGTDAAVRLDDAAKFFTVVVDGTVGQTLATVGGEQSYAVATGLPAGEHEVRLYRRTEASFGETRFLGVEFGSGGTLLAPPAPAARRIEIIGDSITCGYGNEGADENCSFSADTENHYLTYGAIAARNVAADLITVAWSGKGIVYNYDDDKTDPMPALYDRTLPYTAGSQWDFSWQPDAVVINLGTNDFSTDGDPSEATFSDAYQAFVLHLRSKYPNAWIICLAPSLLGGTDFTSAESYIQKVVTQVADPKVKAVSLTFQSSGWGCDWHPSLATHASMADALTQELKTTLGW